MRDFALTTGDLNVATVLAHDPVADRALAETARVLRTAVPAYPLRRPEFWHPVS